MGMILAKKYELKLRKRRGSGDADDEESEKLIQDLELQYQQFKWKKYACYVERQQGPEISLMTEIVFNNDYESLFPATYNKADEDLIDGTHKEWWLQQNYSRKNTLLRMPIYDFEGK